MYTIYEKLILFIITLIDKFERTDEKLIKSFDISDLGIEIRSDKGFVPVSQIHMTRPFEVWVLELEDGKQLECADEHIVFDENMQQVFIMDLRKNDCVWTEDGLKKVVNIYKTADKVCMSDITVNSPDHRFYSNGILSHNTTTSAIYLLWYILFNVDKNALVVANKYKTAIEILSKIKDIFYEVPPFLKPGVVKWNDGEIVLDNGCRIMAEATTVNSGIGFTYHCVLADEFAHLPKNIMEPFYKNLLPTVTAAKAKFMITSTQNGFNLFQKLCAAAEAGENDYALYKTDWDEVPEWNPDTMQFEPRTEEWHQRQVGNYGSEEAFNEQFGINFCVTAKTLIDKKKIREVKKTAVQFVEKEDWLYAASFYMHPDIQEDELKRGKYIITVDIAEGVGKDCTIFNINRIWKEADDYKTVCVGYFANNKMAIDDTVTALANFCIAHFNKNNYIISLEYNLYGEFFYHLMMSKINNGTISYTQFDESLFIKYPRNMDSKSLIPGIRMTAATKNLYCNKYKGEYEKGNIVNDSIKYAIEMENFCDNNDNGRYAAQNGHDDLMMTQIQLEAAKETKYLKYFVEDSAFETNDVAGNMYDYLNTVSINNIIVPTTTYNTAVSRLI